jgi:uncharacterized protein
VIAYVDSSTLARAYLDDEDGSREAQRLLADSGIGKITGPWTRIEVSAAIVRAGRGGRRVPVERKLAVLDADLDEERGRVAVVNAPAERVEAEALELVRTHGLRTLDALHLALASLALPAFARAGEPIAFASRDGDQATVAESLGFERA